MIKRVVKIIAVLIFITTVILYFLFVRFTATKSDKEILKLFSESVIKPKLTQQNFKDFTYRRITIDKDSTAPTIVFIHGTVGSLANFSEYLKDSLLQQKANMIAYDRVGYNYKDKQNTQESIAFEVALLKDLIKNSKNEELILVGYSYGGPIALAFKEKVKRIVLLAPAIYSEAEKMPWMLNFYKWKLTRWLVPDIWKQASKEKISHKEDLQKFEDTWQDTPNKVVTIHGKNDWIVPFKNSKKLESVFLKDDFKIISIKETGHDLVWSNFELIKQELLTTLD